MRRAAYVAALWLGRLWLGPLWLGPLWLGALTLGCDGGVVSIEHEDHGFGEPTTVDDGTDPWRARKRMDIDQLDASMRRVTGGIGWDDRRGDSRFVDNADTLGVPDYINSSTEDRSASLLFTKFVDDAARDVCERTIERESDAASATGLFAPAVLHPSAEGSPATPASAAEVDEALSRLLLRFHGRRVPPGSDALTPWHELHDRVAELAPEDDAATLPWQAVCVALFTHPDFYTY